MTRDQLENVNRARWRPSLALVALILLAVILLLRVSPRLSSRVGKLDFTAYWSASYLLSQGLDYTDEANLREVETSLTGWTHDYTLKLWNLPWAVVWFVPLTLIDFDSAGMLWLLANILLLFVSIVAYWRTYSTSIMTNRLFWLALLVAIAFPATILVLLFGQVSILVLSGLVGFVVQYRKSQDLSAGILLALTTVKPHLVFLVFPLLFMLVIKSGRWKVFIGFALFLVFSTLVGLLFRPTLLYDYVNNTMQANLTTWQSPTLATYLHIVTGWQWVRLIGILLVPIAAVAGWRLGQRLEVGDLINIAILASLIATPFAWSYDFVLLLLPLVRILNWAVEGFYSRLETILLASVTALLYVVVIRQRITAENELYFFWIPLFVAAMYLWARHQANQRTIEL